jgi:23S rRNA pseudouridine1911/1915/1917 synthase
MNGLPPIQIIYEDQDLLALDKPAGVVVHPAYKHPGGTLFDAVVAYLAGQDAARPWLLHRLDKDTSGVVLLAKTTLARRALVRQFERRTVRKRYLALVTGTIPMATEWEINLPLRRLPEDRRRTRVDPLGQVAVTQGRTLVVTGDAALLLLAPITGRTHQLRAHLAYAGCPIVGDPVYSTEETAMLAPRQLLHAVLIGIQVPGSGAYRAFVSPLPDDMTQALQRLLPDAAAMLPQVMQAIYADNYSRA